MDFTRLAYTQRQAKGWTRVCLASGMKALVLLPLVERKHNYGLELKNGCPLSMRELEIVNCVAKGMQNLEIGEILNLSALTVKSHLARIARKAGTGDRAGIVSIAIRSGWLK